MRWHYQWEQKKKEKHKLNVTYKNNKIGIYNIISQSGIGQENI